ncbi:tumor necrosis factor receptor superfamily member 1A isoform X2 [Genypterus blacodes]|uniref:tumor necrosis factor receptor superfamily member 1A isoform X2 n=1 Tax=Genypterus blacodes TaxID=154954 RepID=UPI003F757B85
MGFALVCPLMLTFLSIGLSVMEVQHNISLCSAVCPAGSFIKSYCDGSPGSYICESCREGSTYSDGNNLRECRRCTPCDGKHHQEVEQACSSNRDTKCTCKKGFYNSETLHPQQLDCKRCDPCDGYRTNNMKICQPCQSKENSTTKPSTTMTATPTTTTTITTGAIPNPVISPSANTVTPGPVLTLLAVVVTGLVLLVILVVFTRQPQCCPSCITNSFTEEYTDQLGSPPTQTLNICEETQTQTLCCSPATTGHPNHITPLLLDVEKKASEEEHSDQWPAIVLYAIIKEVPLRRWKEFLRLLSVADQDLERVELEACPSLGLMEKQYLMLRLWSQRPSASLDDVYLALHYMDLTGCAQLLQERLGKLQ